MNSSRTRTQRLLHHSSAPLKLAAVALTMLALAIATRADDGRQPPLPSPMCDRLEVPEGSVMAFHAYASGVQVYEWNGSAWVFKFPSAKLYADADYHGLIGTHFAGPTWKSNSGSQVLGLRLEACTPDSTAIAWLKLAGVSSQGPGIFDGVVFIQRVNTVAGMAPSSPGTGVGQQVGVPYTAEYFFYRAQD